MSLQEPEQRCWVIYFSQCIPSCNLAKRRDCLAAAALLFSMGSNQRLTQLKTLPEDARIRQCSPSLRLLLIGMYLANNSVDQFSLLLGVQSLRRCQGDFLLKLIEFVNLFRGYVLQPTDST